jgi:hypothetical protein
MDPSQSVVYRNQFGKRVLYIGRGNVGTYVIPQPSCRSTPILPPLLRAIDSLDSGSLSASAVDQAGQLRICLALGGPTVYAGV